MPAFVSAQVSISSTAVRAVESADFDRHVAIGTGGATQFQIGYSAAEASTGAIWNADMSTSQGAAVMRFVLPADEELWVRHPTGGANTVHVFVSKAG